MVSIIPLSSFDLQGGKSSSHISITRNTRYGKIEEIPRSTAWINKTTPFNESFIYTVNLCTKKWSAGQDPHKIRVMFFEKQKMRYCMIIFHSE